MPQSVKVTTVREDMLQFWRWVPKWLKTTALVALLAYAVVFVWYYIQNPLGPEIIIRGQAIRIEVAATPEEKQKGLGYRASMPRDFGMLFPFDTRGTHGFWMKGMQFPLDFVWIDGNRIADITQNVPSPTGESDIRHVAPKAPVDKVLELNAGVVAEKGFQVGDTVEFRTE